MRGPGPAEVGPGFLAPAGALLTHDMPALPSMELNVFSALEKSCSFQQVFGTCLSWKHLNKRHSGRWKLECQLSTLRQLHHKDAPFLCARRMYSRHQVLLACVTEGKLSLRGCSDFSSSCTWLVATLARIPDARVLLSLVPVLFLLRGWGCV